MGLPALIFRIKSRFTENPSRPPLNGKEKQLNEQMFEEALREDHVRKTSQIRHASLSRLNALADRVPSLTVAFVGVKGAAATTTTMVHASSVMADNTRGVLVASDFNPASGTGAARLGKDYDETVTLRQLLGDLDSFQHFQDFIRRIRPTVYGVRVISANDIISGNQHLAGADAEKMLEVIGRHCEYHFVDTANDITDEVTQAVVAAADVLVFTANVEVHDSLRQLATGMETLRRHGFEDKVNNAVVLISNLPEGVDLMDYRKFLNRVNIRDEIVQEYEFSGPFLSVPSDAIIKRDTEVELKPLAWRTYQSYLELVISILEQAPEFRAQPFQG